MANNLGSLIVSLGLDAAEFTRGLSKEEYRAQQWARNLSTAFDGIRTAALANFAAIGGAVMILDGQLKQIAGFQDLADQMGDTAQEVASLKTASDLSGVSLEAVTGASVKLTAALAKTDDESKGVGLALKSIGLEVEAFKKLAPAEQMEQVAKSLASVGNASDRTAIAVQLFGRSGAGLIPFLQDLNDEGGRTITLTADQINAADEYAKSLDRLRGYVDNLVKSTAADAAPAMTDMVRLFGDTIRYATSAADGVGLLSGALGVARTAMEAILLIGSDVAFVLTTLAVTARDYIRVSDKLIRGDIDGAKAVGAAYREMSVERRKALDDYQAAVLRRPTATAYSPNDQSSAEARRLGLTPTPRPALTFSAVPSASRARPSGGSTGKDPILEANQREADMLRLLGKIEDEETQKSLDAAKLRRESAIDELEMIDRRNTAYQNYLQTLQDATPTGQLEKQRETMAMLAEEYERGRFGAVGSAEAFTQYSEVVNTFLGQLDTGVKTVNQTAEAAGSIFGTWLERSLSDGMKFKDFIAGLTQDLIKLAIQKQVIEPAVSAVSGGVGGLFSLFSGFNSYDGGGFTGSGSRAGGADGKGGFLAMLHPNETVIDHTKGQGMGGGSGVTINNYIDARGADAGVEARLQQAMKVSASQTKAEILSNMGRGGVWSRAVGRV